MLYCFSLYHVYDQRAKEQSHGSKLIVSVMGIILKNSIGRQKQNVQTGCQQRERLSFFLNDTLLQYTKLCVNISRFSINLFVIQVYIVDSRVSRSFSHRPDIEIMYARLNTEKK